MSFPQAAFPEIIDAFDSRRGSGQLVCSFASSLSLNSRPDLRSITEFFPQLDAKAADAKMREIKMWLKEKGVDDFEKVPLDSEQLDKVRTIQGPRSLLLMMPSRPLCIS